MRYSLRRLLYDCSGFVFKSDGNVGADDLTEKAHVRLIRAVQPAGLWTDDERDFSDDPQLKVPSNCCVLKAGCGGSGRMPGCKILKREIKLYKAMLERTKTICDS